MKKILVFLILFFSNMYSMETQPLIASMSDSEICDKFIADLEHDAEIIIADDLVPFLASKLKTHYSSEIDTKAAKVGVVVLEAANDALKSKQDTHISKNYSAAISIGMAILTTIISTLITAYVKKN